MGLCALVWNLLSLLWSTDDSFLSRSTVSLVLQTGSAADTGGGPGLPQDCLHWCSARQHPVEDAARQAQHDHQGRLWVASSCFSWISSLELPFFAWVASLCLNCLSLLELPLFAWIAAFPCTCLMAILTHSPVLAFLFCFCDHAVDGKWMNDLPVCHWPIMYQFVTDQWCTNMSFTDKWCTSLSLMNGLPICLWPMIYETVTEEWSANLSQTSVWSG